ncbi:hypothetical protein FM106_03950 [Brachybacterium faecium]|nr:hypothetical protein FM106_03950 [Brachybacterium faecium]
MSRYPLFTLLLIYSYSDFSRKNTKKRKYVRFLRKKRIALKTLSDFLKSTITFIKGFLKTTRKRTTIVFIALFLPHSSF